MDAQARSEARADLARLVSDVSEDSYFTWWMPGIEFSAWEAHATGGKGGASGLVEPSDWQRGELVRLSAELGEWPVRDLPDGMSAVASETVSLETYDETFSFVTLDEMARHTGHAPASPAP